MVTVGEDIVHGTDGEDIITVLGMDPITTLHGEILTGTRHLGDGDGIPGMVPDGTIMPGTTRIGVVHTVTGTILITTLVIATIGEAIKMAIMQAIGTVLTDTLTAITTAMDTMPTTTAVFSMEVPTEVTTTILAQEEVWHLIPLTVQPMVEIVPTITKDWL